MAPAAALSADRPCRVALLDPHPVLRLGVEVLLRQHNGVQVRVSLSSEQRLLRLLERSPTCIDLLVFDALPMGDLGDGVALLRVLSQRWPTLPVLVLSAHCNASAVTTTMRAGARGFLSKSTAPDMLLRAVDVVARGGRFVPPELRAELNLPGARHAPTPTLAPLSQREREVLGLVLKGFSTTEMALRAGRSASTISSQKTSAYRKLGIRGDGDLFRFRHLLECG
ncbi:DNA-binding NarL/FixJ family response regulator [Stenotrophomonas sp. AN71]|uniref:response regulator n=1 Tax=Stenotrophomonas sp. AN71 TaxID=3156253 RepID=UPI003D1FF35A